jgi:hypothetical protein
MGAKAFFERFDIPLQGLIRWPSQTVYVDPHIGKVVPSPTNPPSTNSSIDAIKSYGAVIEPWQDFLLPGYWNFPPGDEIPEDLLLDFPDFIQKYNLSDAAHVFAYVAGIDVKAVRPTLYDVMNFGTHIVDGYLGDTFFNPVSFNNSLIYGKSEELLGRDVMLTTTIVKASRSDNGVRLVIKDHSTGSE